jgi:peptidoglycan/xylan/chitin deacetylase (PgdA/CDA1 family)
MKPVVLAGLGAAILHAGPAVTTLMPLRRAAFPGLSGQGAPDRVALTFDDGPDPASTPLFLEFLASWKVQATFFLLGSQLRLSPGLGKEIVDAGHEVAVHGNEHRCLLWRSPAATYRDLATARDVIGDLTGQQPRFYRPPYGVLTGAAAAAAGRLGLRPVLWTAWGRDWEAGATPASVAATVLRRTGPGGTILLHDSDCTSAPGSWQRTLASLPEIVTTVRGKGLTLGPLGAHGLPIRPTDALAACR